MTIFDMVERLITKEGGYVDSVHDSGGATKYGITKNLARAYNYTGPMRDLTLEFASFVYVSEFCDPLKILDLKEVDDEVAYRVLEFAVHAGNTIAVRVMQRLLNSLNRNEKDYPDLKVDGLVGYKTIASLKCYTDRRGAHMFVNTYKSMVTVFYIELAEKRPKDEQNINGWVERLYT